MSACGAPFGQWCGVAQLRLGSAGFEGGFRADSDNKLCGTAAGRVQWEGRGKRERVREREGERKRERERGHISGETTV